MKISCPTIGITLDYDASRTGYFSYYEYCNSVERAGGIPLLIPFRIDTKLVPELVARLDGVVLTGGDDLDPIKWGESRHQEAKALDPLRESFEYFLLKEIERLRIPVLGICLGSQLMNAYRGGSLHQFLPESVSGTRIEHRRFEDWGRRHRVSLVPGSKLAEATDSAELFVNTSHKQAVNLVGEGLIVTARSDDGVVEGIEDPTLPHFVGVQWHPERLASTVPQQNAIFRKLIDVARIRSKTLI